jgi:PAS domain S-box-containing protein
MLVLGIVVFLAGVLLVAGDTYASRVRRREEQASLQSKSQGLAARLAALESHLPQALVMMDSRGLIRRVNPAAESLFGYLEEELFGHNILRLLPIAPSALNPAAMHIAAADDTGAAEMEVRCKDQSTVKVRMTGTRSESEGQSDFYMFFEAASTAVPGSAPSPPSAPALAPSLAMLERVVGRITGKFEELLTTINGYAELALHAAPTESPLRPHLEEIVAASEQATFLARNLLTFSGSQLIPVAPVDLNTVARDAVNDLSRTVELDLSEESPIALANRECLHQVILLLAESAGLRVAEEPGRIRIQTNRCDLDRPRSLYSGEVPAGNYAVIAISDTGTPLDAEVLEHMFEPLYFNPELLGVDLSPIYGIVSNLGGGLHVESGTRGTRFEIWLPVSEKESGAQGSRSRGAVANG